MKRISNFPDLSSFTTDPVFPLSCFQLQCNSLILSLGAVPKTQTTTSLECNEEEDKQTEGMWWRYSSIRNADELKLNRETARCFTTQSHQVGACHKQVSKFGLNHYEKYLTMQRCSVVTVPSTTGHQKPGTAATDMEDKEWRKGTESTQLGKRYPPGSLRVPQNKQQGHSSTLLNPGFSLSRDL